MTDEILNLKNKNLELISLIIEKMNNQTLENNDENFLKFKLDNMHKKLISIGKGL